MNEDILGAGLLAIREAHRNCVDAAHGGHDFEACPVLAEWRRQIAEARYHEERMERSHRERHALYRECTA